MYIYKEQEIRNADNQASKFGLNVFSLMENAGKAIFNFLSIHLKKTERILILAGKGNNGGDGIVLARYLKLNGFNVELVFPFGEPSSTTSVEHYNVFTSSGFQEGKAAGRFDVIIDAMLGVGTKLPLRKEVGSWVNWANTQEAKRIAIDLPTGVEADTGKIAEHAYKADLTVALHGYKPSAFLHPSSDYYGDLHVVDIGLPHNGTWRIWTKEDVAITYPSRNSHSHKGSYGTGLLVAGSDEMPGSALLAGIGAMRSGIGKLEIATTPFASSIISPKLPEATFIHNGLMKMANGMVPDKIRAAAVGPGLVEEALIGEAIQSMLREGIPLVLDASALAPRTYPNSSVPIVLTPHPGEFSKMTGLSISTIQENRLNLASKFAQEQDVILVLKGKNSVIAFPDGSGYINMTGNSALAKGGTGDALTGMILAGLCTHSSEKSAVLNAVYIHGKCAEVWTEEYTEESMLASDIDFLLPKVLKLVQEGVPKT